VGEFPDVWSTEKVGVKTSDIDAVHDTLAAWASGLNKEKTIEALTSGERSSDDAANIGSELDEKFGIWKYFASQQPLRTEEQLASIRQAALSPWAVPPTDHEHGKESDRYRTTYQRDRDRVLWSAGLRRLSNKTQLFPTQHDDDLRQRLTHSIEVYQLAATIGTSFGLDGDLIEAGALAHDIGHTPFGHAGEYALNQLFNEIHRELGGFNHYEHGVDVVRFLEGPYYASSTTQFSGLNLSDEVLECIFKHTYCHAGDLGSEDLLKISKHQDRIRSGFCHLEGQAVRAADKISYLISDIEDGIRLSCLTHSDLLSCRLFHRPPLNFHPKRDQTLHEQFLEQRRILLKILMEDILKASSKRLELLSPKSYSSAAGATEYTIQHSDDILGDISEVWRKLQSGKLHKDGRVVSANLQAARVVAELTTVYSVIPDLIDNRFRLEYERLKMSKYLDAYRKRVGTGHKVEIRSELISFLPMHLLIGSAKEPGKPSHVPVEDLIMSKDYVAGLSDSRARQLHQDIFKS
jgi:dGTPase